jgi:hypothetical protein
MSGKSPKPKKITLISKHGLWLLAKLEFAVMGVVLNKRIRTKSNFKLNGTCKQLNDRLRQRSIDSPKRAMLEDLFDTFWIKCEKSQANLKCAIMR